MIISVTFRNTEGESWQRGYVEERMQKIKKYVDKAVEAHVILSVEKFRNVVEINFAANGLNINAKEEEKDMHLAIDNAIVKIERQLKKHKEKIRYHKNSSLREEGGAGGGSAADDLEDLSGIEAVSVRSLALKPMSMEDAVMEMETTKNMFVVYRDSTTENINVMYRQEDGKFALIETTG
ncbi:MAG: ribosome-associated translation inhibitor RaiA [Nitrospirota bacterium]|nr:ribosome-associated translation inhibitor RaiA [Nitrospirota bacterium]